MKMFLPKNKPLNSYFSGKGLHTSKNIENKVPKKILFGDFSKGKNVDFTANHLVSETKTPLC